MYDWTDYLFGAVVATIIIATVVLFGWLIYDTWFMRHEYYNLRTDEWFCTQEHTNMIPQYHYDSKGNFQYISYIPITECVSYHMKGY